jgi:hypothetical protein
MFKKVLSATVIAAATALAPAAHGQDWSKVAAALGKSGTEMPGGIYRIGLPRSDLHVTLDGIVLKPTLALGSWLAFAPMGDKTMVMGDLVLTEDEIGPVMQKLAEEHINITGLHNHLLRARPATFYMHVQGEGEATALAKELHDALALSHTPLGSSPPPAAASKIDLDTAAVDKALGASGKVAGGVYQIGIPRAETPKAHGMEVPPALGTAEAINLQPLGGGQVAATGDFVLVASEVNPVLRTLRANGVEVTALHNHMLDDEPRLFFMHFWVHGNVDNVLKGLRAALDEIAVKRSESK